MDITAIKGLERDAELRNTNGKKFKVLEKSPELIWLSHPDKPEAGWRCFSVADLEKEGLSE